MNLIKLKKLSDKRLLQIKRMIKLRLPHASFTRVRASNLYGKHDVFWFHEISRELKRRDYAKKYTPMGKNRA